MEFLQRLDAALEYIEANLAGEISFEQAAKLACCSTYYFQRMFSYMAGIPVSEYIRRRRMSAAAFDLRDEAAKVSEIAAKYGYKSPTAFNRAFQSVHGVAPSAVWGKEALLTTYPRLHFHIAVTGTERLKYRIETRGPLRVVGVRMGLAPDMEQNFGAIPEFWRKAKNDGTLGEIAKLMTEDSRAMLGVTLYYGPEDIGYTIGAASAAPVPAGMVECEIPAATWAVFPCVGPAPAAFQELYRRFYTEWLPVSDYAYTNGPDLEVYTDAAITAPTYQCELWMAVTKK
jgi:AraC family transcriptional regulator